MKIIAFLGNKGRKFRNNRHNTGFIAGQYFIEQNNIPLKKKEFSSVCGTGKIDNTDILVMFPETLMNGSGRAVNAALRYYNESPENLIAVHDEIELPFGEIRTKFGGGHKGHNGIRSIIQHTGSPDFQRLRIGIGRPENPEWKVADYLLSDFTGEELKKITELLPAITQTLVSLILKQLTIK